MAKTDRDYAECMELVEHVMECIGMRWTPSMIRRELREYFGNDLSFKTCNYLMKTAKAEIRKRYNIDPQYYKGVQIEFYESVIRNKHERTKERLTAAERLDKLFGLEQITADDPEVQARKIREALKEMDESIGEQDGGEQKSDEENKERTKGNIDGGDGKDEKETTGRNIVSRPEQETIGRDDGGKTESPIEDDSVSQEFVEEIKNLKDEDFDRFRKKK